MARILIVEDDELMSGALEDQLKFDGYEIDLAADGDEGLKKIEDNIYDLILLDVMLPKKSGFDVCREIRDKKIKTPLLMLTAKGEEIDKVLGLELGADDYITKPFSLRELQARIKAALRRSSQSESRGKIYQFGRLTVNFDTYEAYENDVPVSLSHREFEVLKYFTKHENETVERDTLLTEIWGYENLVTTRVVDNFIVKLRQKLEVDPAHPKHILTVYGIGYKYIR
jgi:DNA-binding response OmpR family regulator